MACVPRQAVWKRVRLASLEQRQAITQRQATWCFYVHGLQGFGDTLKVGLLGIP